MLCIEQMQLLVKNISIAIYTILFLYFSSNSFQSYYNGNVVYDVSYSEEESIAFPSITLCPSPKSVGSIGKLQESKVTILLNQEYSQISVYLRMQKILENHPEIGAMMESNENILKIFAMLPNLESIVNGYSFKKEDIFPQKISPDFLLVFCKINYLTFLSILNLKN